MGEKDLYYRFLVSVITKSGNSENFLNEDVDEREYRYMSEKEIGKRLAESAKQRGLLDNKSVREQGTEVIFISAYKRDSDTHITVFPKPLISAQEKYPLITTFFETVESYLLSPRTAE